MIAIIGGSGFVGTRLSRRLHAAGTPFRIIDKSVSAAFPNHCRLADVRDLEALNSAVPPNTDVIINLAAEHRDLGDRPAPGQQAEAQEAEEDPEV